MLEGFQPVTVDTFGSLYTFMDRSDLPIGLSPDCQNLEFFPGGCRSRVGLKSHVYHLAETDISIIRSITDFIKTDGTKWRILLNDTGMLTKETGAFLGSIVSGLIPGMLMRATQFGDRIYLAFSDGRLGSDRPRQWDGSAVFDPLSQGGPAALPTYTEGMASTGVWGGVRNYLLVFETQNGYLTLGCVPGAATFSLNHVASFSDIAIGPPNVIRRRIYVTLDNGTDTPDFRFYTHPDLWLTDPTATTLSNVSLTDAALGAQALVDTSSQLIYSGIRPLPQAAGLESYSSRLVAWGVRHVIPRVPFEVPDTTFEGPPGNLDFDGGVLEDEPISGKVVPTGWNGTGWDSGATRGELELVDGGAGMSWKMTGNGVAATVGKLVSTKPVSNFQNVEPSRFYRMRVKAKRNSALASGTLYLYATGYGPGYWGLHLSAAELSTEWAWYDAALCDAEAGRPYEPDPGYDPPPPVLNLYLGDTPTGGGCVWVDEIQVYPSDQESDPSWLYVSEWNNPETFLYSRCVVPINDNDGQAITNCYEIRGTLRVCKDYSTYSLMDNGADPVDWTLDQFSDVVGCVGPWAAGKGDGWVAVAADDGLYIDNGSTFAKVSQEIQPDWDSLNPTYRHLVSVAVDTSERRIFVLLPLGTSRQLDTLFVMDYVRGFGDPIESGGEGRKWTRWTMPAEFTSMGYLAQNDGSWAMMFAGGETDQYMCVMKQDPNKLLTYDWVDTSGDPVPLAFTSYYETASIGTDLGRSLVGYLTMRLRGTGTVLSNLVTASGGYIPLPTKTLESTHGHDIEIWTNRTGVQTGIRFGTSSAFDSFSIRRLSLYLKSAPFSRMRGHND